MTDDTNMAGDTTASSKVKEATTTDTTTTTEVLDATAQTTTTPPLVMAALRLEKILSDHAKSSSSSSSSSTSTSYYINPVKAVRRWLGTSSGATSSSSSTTSTPTATATATAISIQDIQTATMLLLDPSMTCIQNGRALLLSKVAEAIQDATATSTTSTATGSTDMETDESSPTTETDIAATTTTTRTSDETSLVKKNQYVTIASAREIEAWLFSLYIRTLWKQQHYYEAMIFADAALNCTTGHFHTPHNTNTGTTNYSSSSDIIQSSMYPLTARLYRFAALAYESFTTSVKNISDSSNTTTMNSMTNTGYYSNILSAMSKAHTFATVRRDVDTQATTLNIMLRELLRCTQGTVKRIASMSSTPFLIT
jgi:hypothetical protein